MSMKQALRSTSELRKRLLNDPRVPRLVSEQQLEEITGIGARTWQDWRLKRKGPRFIKCGRLVRYDLAEVERWLAARTIETADPSLAAAGAR